MKAGDQRGNGSTGATASSLGRGGGALPGRNRTERFGPGNVAGRFTW